MLEVYSELQAYDRKRERPALVWGFIIVIIAGFNLTITSLLVWHVWRSIKWSTTVSILGWLAPQEGLNFMQYPIQGDYNNGEVLFGPTS